jgi:hypothetical protein
VEDVTDQEIGNRVESLLAMQGGVLRLLPAWVARDFLLPGRRLGVMPGQVG